jgi:hypothetical protein
MGDDSLAFRLWVDGGDCANCCNNTDEFCNRCASTILICCNYHYFANVACMIHFLMYFVSTRPWFWSVSWVGTNYFN